MGFAKDGMRRRSSQKQQQCAATTFTDAAATGAFADTAPKATSQGAAAPKEKSTKAVCRRSAQRQQARAAKAVKDAVVTETTPKAPRSNSQTDTSKLAPRFDEVFACIESLYADQLKPFGRILRKRVAERTTVSSGVAQYNEENLSDVDAKYLRTICEESDSVQVEPEEGGDWSATIIGRPDTFVDVYSSVDVYPTGMWGAAATYFQLLSGDDMHLPGGRYSCAQELQARSLAFLKGRSLGQVCHIVQLAISQQKLLGYLNGAVVPYAFSQSMLKEQCAQRNAACTASRASGNETGKSATENSLNMATWEMAREFLREILNDSAKSKPDMVGTVPLSNVKRLFRSKFHTELSETKLGHSKLTQLLQDDRFSDICNVQLHGHGYVVNQVVPQENHAICLDTLPTTPRLLEVVPQENHAICLDTLPTREGDLPTRLWSQEPLTLDMNECGMFEGSSPTVGKARWPPADGYVCSLVQRTFIHASLPPPTPPPNARRRSASLPKDAGSATKSFLELQSGSIQQEQAEETDSTVDSANGSDGADLSQSCETSWSALDDPIRVLLRECNSMEHMKAEDSAEDVLPRQRLQFCPDEPLALEEAGMFLDSAPVTQTPYTPTFPRWSLRMPSPPSTEKERAETESHCRPQFCTDEPLALDEADIFLDSALMPPTPYTPQSLPRWPCLAPSLLAMDGWPGAEQTSWYVDDSVSRPCFQFCPDEPLALDEADLFIDSTPSKGMCARQPSSRWPCLSPSSLVRDGCVGSIALSRVQNTFIHSPARPLHSLPPTPLRVGASRRSRSLPKNVGSDKNLWEATCQALGMQPSPRSAEECSFNAGDCPHTPSVYVDYIVPPSPDFPTYCKTPQLGSLTAAFQAFSSVAVPPPLTGHYIWPVSSCNLPNVIRIADFLQ